MPPEEANMTPDFDYTHLATDMQAADAEFERLAERARNGEPVYLGCTERAYKLAAELVREAKITINQGRFLVGLPPLSRSA